MIDGKHAPDCQKVRVSHNARCTCEHSTPPLAPAGLPEWVQHNLQVCRSEKYRDGIGDTALYLAGALAQAQARSRQQDDAYARAALALGECLAERDTLREQLTRVQGERDKAQAQAQHYKQQCAWAEEHIDAFQPLVNVALATWPPETVRLLMQGALDRATRGTAPTPDQPREEVP